MALACARQPVHRRTPADSRTERTRTAHRNQATAGSIHTPLILVQPLARQNRLHHRDRHKARALPPHPRSRQTPGRRRPERARRHHKGDLVQIGERGTETDRGRGRARRRIQPLFQHAHARHRTGDRAIQRVAVIDHVHTIAGARIRPDAPGAGGSQFNDQSEFHERFTYSPVTKENADSLTAA